MATFIPSSEEEEMVVGMGESLLEGGSFDGNDTSP
jgi:hypothetical protein